MMRVSFLYKLWFYVCFFIWCLFFLSILIISKHVLCVCYIHFFYLFNTKMSHIQYFVIYHMIDIKRQKSYNYGCVVTKLLLSLSYNTFIYRQILIQRFSFIFLTAFLLTTLYYMSSSFTSFFHQDCFSFF